MNKKGDTFLMNRLMDRLMIKNICHGLELSFSICEKNKIIFTPLIEYLNLWNEIVHVLEKRISELNDLIIDLRLDQCLMSIKQFWLSYNSEDRKNWNKDLEYIKNEFDTNFRKIRYNSGIYSFSLFEEYETLMNKWYGLFLTNIKNHVK